MTSRRTTPPASTPSRSARSAFTLLELVLVLVIISVVLAMAAPSLQGWARGAKLRNAADDVLRATRGARTAAVTNATIHRLYFDAGTGRYWLAAQDGGDFTKVDTSYGREQTIAEGLTLELTKTIAADEANAGFGAGRTTTATPAAGADGQYVEFSPTGRTQPAVIKIASEAGYEISIECVSPAEPFRTAASNGNQQ